jgi:hypothetical protein
MLNIAHGNARNNFKFVLSKTPPPGWPWGSVIHDKSKNSNAGAPRVRSSQLFHQKCLSNSNTFVAMPQETALKIQDALNFAQSKHAPWRMQVDNSW